jgi:N6-L-threonylcarbamoyladenine synthase
VLISGGVAANGPLRESLRRHSPVPVWVPPPVLCTDNGAMIAAMGYNLAVANRTTSPLTLKTDPSLAV